MGTASKESLDIPSSVQINYRGYVLTKEELVEMRRILF